MEEHVKQALEQFDLKSLRQELALRASDGRESSARLTGSDVTLAGRSSLGDFATRDIATVLRDGQKVIYGVDDRKDLFEVSDPQVRERARGVVSLFRSTNIVDNGDETSTLLTGKFAALRSLCEQEPFGQQPAGAFCTGFLVAPDIIATAGHCVDAENVTNVRFVFGFEMLDSTTAQTTVPNRDIYAGAELIGRHLTEDATDWAVVRLDRPVEGRPVLPVRREGAISAADPVYVIGHPSGLPIKFADGAEVRDSSHEAFFVANLDTYGGNSGSPVFNANHEVEGILVRGETDFVPFGFCMVSAVCPTTGCQGEACTRASEFIHLLPPGS